MYYDIPSSPLVHEAGDNWNTPKHARVHQMWHDGNSWGVIKKELGVKQSTAQSICKDPSSHTMHKGKVYHHRLINTWTICQIIRHFSHDYPSCWLSFEQVQQQLNLVASARTIWQELCCSGYWCCISCPRPYISHAQAKKRLDFALAHQWWGTSDYAANRDDGRPGGDWRKVIWSDKATFEVGKSGRIWVTWQVDEKCCPSCIQ